ncbi:SDR family NAD(P)-dependent oxidoreductase [Rhodococcoides kyotonense]|uniref:SDR family NAD(P)-dependent oxidoreductase n=1 Tax=Rhodococcoides kyotonense TaxID=398843 RepID=UPI001C3D566D|nr:SDR family oxidoreductase [Rhodococcus kyotonensis]
MVTGAGGGLGVAIASTLVGLGANVALIDRDEEALTNAAASMTGGEGRIETFCIDLADAEQTASLPALVEERMGLISILVNNAGIRSISPLIEHSLDSWRATLDVNLTAPFLLIKNTAPQMLASGGGAIVNVTSVAAELGFKNRSSYNASKGGLEMLTKSAALELGGSGIRCNAVAPGIIETPLNSSYFQDEAFAARIVDNTPARAWGRPSDIAEAVAFLCGDGSRFINGATLLVDGGWSAGKGY